MEFRTSWEDEGWRSAVEDWLALSLEQVGLKAAGEIQLVQQRAWSIVLLVPTDGGALYFKASAPGLQHEAALTAWLAARFPRMIPPVLAIDPEAGWQLQRSAGVRWREAVEADNLLERWQELLPAYASMQRQLQTEIEALNQLGLPDRRPQKLPAHVTRWCRQMTPGSPSDSKLSAAELEGLRRIQPEVGRICQQLSELAPTCSINHGDLHDGNLAMEGDSYRIFDWGDASLSHPFVSLRSSFVSLENRLGLAQGAPELQELERLYLLAWTEQADIESLQQAFGLAKRIWSIVTALGWEAALESAPVESRAQYSYVLPSLMRELLVAFDESIDQPI